MNKKTSTGPARLHLGALSWVHSTYTYTFYRNNQEIVLLLGNRLILQAITIHPRRNSSHLDAHQNVFSVTKSFVCSAALLLV